MTKGFVLMTAMPPTTGHQALIDYATHLIEDKVVVIVSTQPDEPMAYERFYAVQEQYVHNYKVDVRHIHRHLPQEPSTGGFWDMWVGFLKEHGFQPGDYIIASEPYGVRLAEEAGGVFMPFDIDRFCNPIKATAVREDLIHHFDELMPSFRKYVASFVTVYGAESIGKTTLTRDISQGNPLFAGVFEWARPYLEAVGPELTREKMVNIWQGQYALQKMHMDNPTKPITVFDTDLFSTLGYWSMHIDTLGPVPYDLAGDAFERQSDVYVMPSSNIPFEQDQLRYGGDKREGSDQFWYDILNTYNLPRFKFDETNAFVRTMMTQSFLIANYNDEFDFSYEREANG